MSYSLTISFGSRTRA